MHPKFERKFLEQSSPLTTPDFAGRGLVLLGRAISLLVAPTSAMDAPAYRQPRHIWPRHIICCGRTRRAIAGRVTSLVDHRRSPSMASGQAKTLLSVATRCWPSLRMVVSHY